MSEYATTIWGEQYCISGDFSQASSPVRFDGEVTPYQVADFQHRPSLAMRRYLEGTAQAGGSDPDAPEVQAEINEALKHMAPANPGLVSIRCFTARNTETGETTDATIYLRDDGCLVAYADEDDNFESPLGEIAYPGDDSVDDLENSLS